MAFGNTQIGSRQLEAGLAVPGRSEVAKLGHAQVGGRAVHAGKLCASLTLAQL